MDLFVHLIVQKYTVIYYHNISTYRLMYAVMLCTSLLQNASLLSSALRFWMLSPCRFCVERLLGPRSDVSDTGRTCLLKSHTLTQECSEVINCSELILFTVLSKMTQDLGSFCSSLWNQINESWGPNNPPKFLGEYGIHALIWRSDVMYLNQLVCIFHFQAQQCCVPKIWHDGSTN